MFEKGNKDELKLVYSVFNRDESALSQIVGKMMPYLMARGEAIIENEENLKDP